MEEDTAKLLLQGITIGEFKILYMVGIVGIIARFLYNVIQGVRRDPDTPQKFQFRYFLKGLARIVLSLIILAIVIAQFQEFSPDIMNLEIEFSTPTRLPDGIEVKAIAGITAKLAFMTGLGIDEIIKRLVGKGDKIITKLKNGK